VIALTAKTYSNAGGKRWQKATLSGTSEFEPRFLNGLQRSSNRMAAARRISLRNKFLSARK
jgi:hypothetical protein